MPSTSAERVRAYRARQRAAGEPDSTRRNKAKDRAAYKVRRRQRAKLRPFCGCDGEGAGTDALGRQNYVLFRMGNRELFEHGRRLETAELLDFICDHPAGEILVGFAFGYDVTMILRDMPHVQQAKLFAPKEFGPGKSRYVWFRDFNVEYLPKNYLRVCRIRRVRDAEGRERREIVKGSTRTIYETFGFFQMSFVKAVDNFSVATEAELKQLKASKDVRGDDAWRITKRERDYCALECRLLSELMEKLREYCEAAGIRPNSWSGAGKLAKALHRDHGTVTAKELAELVPADLMDFASMAYYGGRFEITRTGLIEQDVHEYDIRSAYPAAMGKLPCLRHGRWSRATAGELAAHARQGGLYVAACTFNRERQGDGMGDLGALPVRLKEGHLTWPLRGGGVYWSVEIESAKRAGFKVRCKGGWTYAATCSCKPFDWVEALYDYRRSIGSSGPGYPIKLGINSLYGLLAQRRGNGVFTNMIWAGLITAWTRATLNDAITLAGPDNVVMVATDAVYSLKPLALDVGEKLGQWEGQVMPGLMIVQPGLYWCPARRKRKSRGLSGKFFEEPGMTEGFERAWLEFKASDQGAGVDAARDNGGAIPFPSVRVPVPGFIGLKLAIARGKPDLAGTWISDTREISFDYRNKRLRHVWQGNAIVTGPKPGAPGLVSLPHRDFLSAGGAEPWEAARLMLDEQPSYIDLGIPFQD